MKYSSKIDRLIISERGTDALTLTAVGGAFAVDSPDKIFHAVGVALTAITVAGLGRYFYNYFRNYEKESR